MYKVSVYEDNGNLYLKSPVGYIRVEKEFNGNDVILKPTNDRVAELVAPIEKDISLLKAESEVKKEDVEEEVSKKDTTKFNRNKKFIK